MKRKLAMLLAVMCLLIPTGAYANEKKAEVEIEAGAAILIDAATNKVLYEHNANEVMPPASLTKIMTLAIINDEIRKGTIKWDTKVKVSKNAWTTGGSKMFIEVDTEVSVRDLVKGIAIVSGNDAAVAMAERISGSTDKFIERMNQKAKEIGMKKTKFTSVNGLSYEDESTASDLGKLTYYYLHNYPEMTEVHKTQEFEYNKIKQANRNPMLTNYDGADGLKTGFIKTNYNLISTAKRNGTRLIVVSLDSKTGGQRFRTHRNLFDYGFTQFKEENQGKKGEVVAELAVYKAKDVKTVPVALKKDINYSVSITSKEKPKVEIELPEHLEGEMKKGTVVGQKIVKIGTQTLTSDIVLTKDLEKAWFGQRMLDSFKLMGLFGKIGIFVLFALIIGAFIKMKKDQK